MKDSHELLRLSAQLTIVGVVLSGPLALVFVTLTAPQPAWRGPEAFVEHFDWIQVIPFVAGFVLVGGHILFIAACHSLTVPDRKALSSSALILTAVYAVIVIGNYVTQSVVVPSVLDQGELVTLLSMSNPNSIAWVLEMFAYGFVGTATWLVWDVFGSGRLARPIRTLLATNGIASILGAAAMFIPDRSWILAPAGLAVYALWNLLLLVLMALTILWVRERISQRSNP